MDSLLSVWKDVIKQDSLGLNALGEYPWNIIFTEPDSTMYYGQLEYDNATSVKSKKHIVHAQKALGTANWMKGNYIESLRHFEKELNDKEGIAATLNKFGLVYSDMGNGIKALNYLKKSLKICEELGIDDKSFFTLNTIDDLYYNQ